MVLDPDLMEHERVNFHPLVNTMTTALVPPGSGAVSAREGHKPDILGSRNGPPRRLDAAESPKGQIKRRSDYNAIRKDQLIGGQAEQRPLRRPRGDLVKDTTTGFPADVIAPRCRSR